MVSFWAIVPLDGLISGKCNRPINFTTRTENIVVGVTFGILSLVNFFAHLFLISIIFYNWKVIFHNFFIYRLILSMSFMAVINMMAHFIMTIPCSITGCLNYSQGVVGFFTGVWRTLEYGFFIAVLFIAIDRFFMFYARYYGRYFQKIYTIIFLWLITFLAQLVLFFIGCPKVYDVIYLGPVPCLDCLILGASWNQSVRGAIYHLPYPMFVLYILIIGKIVAMRWKVYNKKTSFTKNDQVLAIQFFILCAIQYILSNLEHYLKEEPDNYIGLLLMSVPIVVQFLNALVLLTTNMVVRKGMKKLIYRENGSTKFFASALGAPSQTKMFTWRSQVGVTRSSMLTKSCIG